MMKLSKNIEKNKQEDGSYEITGALRYASMLQNLSDEQVEEYACEIIPERYYHSLVYLHNLRKQLMIWHYGPDILLFEQFDKLKPTKT